MGKIIRKLELKDEKVIDFLSSIYSVNTNDMEILSEDNITTYKNIELDSILVNVSQEQNILKINKLVSLKAFLLSKEQDMNINELLYNINKVMKMSTEELNKTEDFIVLNDSLKQFFKVANIEIIKLGNKDIILSDGKRKVKISKEYNNIYFNTIIEIL